MSQPPLLTVRINQIDYTLAPNGGPLDNAPLPRVPVLRIYGSSSTGQNACVHVHQVYPYFFVEYVGELHPNDVRRYIAKLNHSLNHAIALSLKRNPHSSKSRYIRAILLVKGVHFYGFHSSYSPFLKILVADPAYVNRAATILQSGTVMSTRFCVYESHLSYILQFMCDFGLYGCGLIEFEDAFQRCADDDRDPVEEPTDSSGSDVNTVSFKPSPLFRQSHMPLEVDVIAPQILNRHRLVARNIHHKLEIPAPTLPSEPLVPSVRELWDDERNRRRALGLHPSPEIPIDPTASSRGAGGDWVAEARWWEELRKRIEAEREPANLAKNINWEHWTMTTFESIEALWEKSYKTWKPIRHELENRSNEESSINLEHSLWDVPNEVVEGDEQIDIDVAMLSSEEMSQLERLENGGLDGIPAEEHQQFQDNEDDNGEEAQVDEEFSQPDLQDVDDGVGHDATITSNSQDPFLQTINEDISTGNIDYRLPSPPNPLRTDFKDNIHTPRTPTRTSRISSPQQLLDSLSPTPTQTQENATETHAHALELFVPPELSQEELPLQELDLDNSLSNEQSFNGARNVTFANAIVDDIRPLKKRRLTNDNSFNNTVDENMPVSPSSLSANHAKELSLIAARAVQLSRVYTACKSINMNRYEYVTSPPSTSSLLGSLDNFGIPSKVYRAPHYSNYLDVPARSWEYAGLTYDLKCGDLISNLEEWGKVTDVGDVLLPGNVQFDPRGVGGWEYASSPPSVKQVRKWLKSDEGTIPIAYKRADIQSQIKGPTQKNMYGFKTSPIVAISDVSREKQNMSVLSLEVFAPACEDKVPNSETDAVVAAFYAHHVSGAERIETGIIVVRTPQLDQRRLRNIRLDIVNNEIDLLNRVVDVVLEIDPDIVVGWEVQRGSWGYLNARGHHHGFDIDQLLSRAPARQAGGMDQWGARQNSSLKIAGRHVLNLWRIMRAEQTLTSYTFENVAFHILRQRVPHYSITTLTRWYWSPVPAHTTLLMRYLSDRSFMGLQILEEAEIVTKTAEFARVFGVDFFSVISRGSQFKVESFMFRIAKPENFVFISPSKSDVGKQNAAECMPLIMEPMSAFYSSPLVVLDFQSLYPSVMIAYNYCYSTCLGRITDFKGSYKLGVVDLDLPPGLLETLQDHITIAPNGIAYVKSEVRKGLLGRMLVELLESRVMVKQAMKTFKSDKALRRILDARQLGLKYIANVTYGYTAATYSGRMPAVEIADSIVQTGRETLEKAIELINSTPRWGAQVVYGDTDSVFVYLRGKTKDQAFRIGNEIADTVTKLNPAPIKLKFEKVYLPCVLLAKKRYVGFKYENPDDEEPTFDAKGIETVRRDGVLAQRKMTENTLKILFRTQDLSEVKEYCCNSWAKLLENKASIQDFIFAKEVRMGTYSERVAPPPGVMVAARRIMLDANNETQYGDRVPYVIVRGAPGSRLVERAVDPLELINDSQLRLDAIYYISRVLIPPLERIFNLVGADVRQWLNGMPKVTVQESSSPKKVAVDDDTDIPGRLNITEHFRSTQCILCWEPDADDGLCDDCYFSTRETITNIGFRIRPGEKRLLESHLVCVSCTGSAPGEPIECESLDCPWLFARKKAEERTDALTYMRDIADELEQQDDLSSSPTP